VPHDALNEEAAQLRGEGDPLQVRSSAPLAVPPCSPNRVAEVVAVAVADLWKPKEAEVDVGGNDGGLGGLATDPALLDED